MVIRPIIGELEAIYSLVGGKVSQQGKEIVLHDGQVRPSKEAIEAEIKRLQAEDDVQSYARSRADAFDPIPEQLDQIYHDIDGWKKRIKSVKDKYPKPT